jgi:hypothetical protein
LVEPAIALQGGLRFRQEGQVAAGPLPLRGCWNGGPCRGSSKGESVALVCTNLGSLLALGGC